MLKEQFLGRNPSHFLNINPIVKAYIISESFLWSAWNFVTPIFAVFVIQEIEQGNVQVAASAFSIYLVTRVIFELISGNYSAKKSDKKKILITIMGMCCISISYIGFSFTNTIYELFLYYGIAGMGLGIASPAKNALFSVHLDKDKETTEWGMADAAAFISMALATALGGFIAGTYGFHILFIIACTVNLLAIIPYLLYLRQNKFNPK